MTVEETIKFGVRVIYDYPPVWGSVCSTFQIVPRGVIFAYGDCIYNPDKVDLPLFLVEHEKVHFEQQGHTREGAALWWGKFLRDPEFRVSQEVEAYGVQYYEMCKLTGDRNQRAKMLWSLASSLSGPLYNKAITHQEAMRLIKLSSGIK